MRHKQKRPQAQKVEMRKTPHETEIGIGWLTNDAIT